MKMDEIRAHYGSGEGRHWFDKGTMRFFGTRISDTTFTTPNDPSGRTYFITSEQPPFGPRAYSVRAYDPQTREIETIGDVCQDATLKAAQARARFLSGAVKPALRVRR